MYIHIIKFQIDEPDLHSIQTALWDARVKWFNIGLCLKVKESELEAIDHESGSDDGVKLRRMISTRLKMEDPCSRNILFQALIHCTVNEPKLAEQFKPSTVNGMSSFIPYSQY